MSPDDRMYLMERAEIECELAQSAPDQSTAALHLELAARYQVIADSVEVTPKLRLVVNRG